jgi:hypothetical protein
MRQKADGDHAAATAAAGDNPAAGFRDGALPVPRWLQNRALPKVPADFVDYMIVTSAVAGLCIGASTLGRRHKTFFGDFTS